MSAFEDTVPPYSEGGFLVVFFLSFLGRIVSALGFNRTLPLEFIRLDAPRSPLMPMLDCGTELTVSVSTVMLRTDAGALFFVRFVRDFLAIFIPGLVNPLVA